MKTMPIDEFLSWAFVHELAKGGGEAGLNGLSSGWSSILGLQQLGTVIDPGQRDHALANFYEDGEPHPDAIAAGRAVAALEERGIEIPDGWNPVCDWPDEHGLIAGAVAASLERYALRPARSKRQHLVQLVISAAVLGRGPDWRAEPPKARMVCRSGKPAWFISKRVRDTLGHSHVIEINGRDPKSHRVKRGAYRKYELSHDPAADILARLDWHLWVDALHDLTATLDGNLRDHRVLAPAHARNPWKLPGEPVLQDTVLKVEIG